jgi:acyl-CoA reductase-like NAD-dependent aldehyde dehydrogenase
MRANCHDLFDARTPFGGFKAYGSGCEVGHYALQLSAAVKTVFL